MFKALSSRDIKVSDFTGTRSTSTNETAKVFDIENSAPTPEDAKNCISGHELEVGKGRFGLKALWSVYSFDDETIQMCYEKYRIDTSTLMLHVHVLVLLFTMTNFANGLFTAFKLYNGLWVVKAVLVLRIVVLIGFTYVCYRIKKIKSNSNLDQKGYSNAVFTTTNITSCLLVASSIANGTMYVWKSSLPECSDSAEDTLYLYNCNEGYGMGGSAFLSSLVLLVGNSYLVAVFRCHHFVAVQISYCVTMVCCFLAAALSPQPRQSIITIGYSVLLIFMYVNMEMNNFLMFSTLLESEMNKREQAEELKHFIGNVSKICHHHTNYALLTYFVSSILYVFHHCTCIRLLMT